MPWQVMTRASAQAGNRASKTEHYLQWWEHSPEWVAVTPAAQNRHNSTLFVHIFVLFHLVAFHPILLHSIRMH